METKITEEFGGFVKNLDTGEYDLRFRTEISDRLALNRAIEDANVANKYMNGNYDSNDVIIKRRTIEITYGEWNDVV